MQSHLLLFFVEKLVLCLPVCLRVPTTVFASTVGVATTTCETQKAKLLDSHVLLQLTVLPTATTKRENEDSCG